MHVVQTHAAHEMSPVLVERCLSGLYRHAGGERTILICAQCCSSSTGVRLWKAHNELAMLSPVKPKAARQASMPVISHALVTVLQVLLNPTDNLAILRAPEEDGPYLSIPLR